MHALPRTLLLAVLAVAPSPAGAFDTTPWDGAAFEARVGMSASARAKVGAVRATGHAMRDRSRDRVTVNPSGCSVNIGGVTLAPGATANGLSVVSSANLRDVITICR